MINFTKHKSGDTVNVHACDDCCHRQGVRPKRSADSKNASWLCDVCGHYGIGSAMDCMITGWMSLKILPLEPPQ